MSSKNNTEEVNTSSVTPDEYQLLQNKEKKASRLILILIALALGLAFLVANIQLAYNDLAREYNDVVEVTNACLEQPSASFLQEWKYNTDKGKWIKGSSYNFD